MSFILKLAELQTYHEEATRLRGLAMPRLFLSHVPATESNFSPFLLM
jgi:hypothetical protein